MFGFLRKKRPQGPADRVFKIGYLPYGSFLFDDGTFGCIGDPELDIRDLLEDDDRETVGLIEDYYRGIPDRKMRAERLVRGRFGGKIPIGNIYIDRWDLDGRFRQGGCFLCFEGETLRDYCGRNGEPCPVREVPEEVTEAF